MMVEYDNKEVTDTQILLYRKGKLVEEIDLDTFIEENLDGHERVEEDETDGQD
jgi:hypothetical protein